MASFRTLAFLAAVFVARGQEVPLEMGLHHGPILQVEAEQEGGGTRTLRLILDTGATTCVLDPHAAKGLVTAPFKQEILGGFAGASRPAQARRLRRLRSGEAEQSDVPVLVTDLRFVNRGLDRPVDGLLGMSFLAGRRFTLDPIRRVLRWEGPEPDGRQIPLLRDSADARPWAALRIGGRELRALLDTGAGAALVLPSATPGLRPLPECDTVDGVDGSRTVGEARAAVEALGETFPGRRAIVGFSHAILGAPALLAGPAAFDLRRGRLTLTLVDGHLPPPPAEGARSLPLGWNRTGPSPFLEVDDLPRCHRWYRAGFRKGDRVLSVVGLEGSALTLNALDDLLGRGRILDWMVARGRRTLTLRNPNEDPRLEPLDAPSAGP